MSLHTLAELTADFVVYRNLVPFDSRVPGIATAWQEMGMPGPGIVRKRDPVYAQVTAWFLRQFHALHAPGVAPRELLFIGDTLGNDGGAFLALSAATGWTGAAFIGDEAAIPIAQPAQAVTQGEWQETIYLARRWQGLAEWLRQLQLRGLALDAQTIVVVDIDKTALGARGRNHLPIDATRLAGMRQTVLAALDASAPSLATPGPDPAAFESIYHILNAPAYKDLTADNQDYLAYICIMVGAGVVSMTDLAAAYARGEVGSFAAFIGKIEAQTATLSSALRDLHHQVYTAWQQGDPTPFKTFRRQEYLAAVSRMGHLPDDADLERRLAEEICLTREVWDACQWLRRRGALITALSDKPDEACAPPPALAAQGYLPIQSTPTHLAGDALDLSWLG